MRLGLLPRILRQITNGAFTPTLSSLGLSNSVFPENATAGTVFAALTGMTGGSSLSLTTTDGTRVALSGTNITAGATSLNYEVDTTARSFQVTETLAGAVGSPKVTTLNYTIGNLNDTNPSAFTFTDVTGVLLSTAETSNLITVAGLGASDSATATLSGAASSQLSLNGGAYVSGPVTVVNGDTIAVRHTSSGSFSTATNTTLTIGTTSDTYTSTTGASDTVPDAFSFTDVSGAALSTLQTSAAITPAGYTAAATISITGGEYEINGSGTWVTSSGTISPAQSVKVRHTSSASNSTAVNTVLTIGGVSDTFTSTTAAVGGTMTAPTPAFDTPTYLNPPNVSYTLPLDGSVVSGDWIGREFATNAGFTSSTTDWHQLTDADIITGDFTWVLNGGTPFADGTLYLRAYSARGPGVGSFTLTSSPSTAISRAVYDGIPSAWDFVDQTGVATSSTITSATVTPTGYTGATDVITNGNLVSINGGTFSTADTTLSPGQTIAVRGTSDAGAGNSVTLTINVAGVDVTWTTTTASAGVIFTAISTQPTISSGTSSNTHTFASQTFTAGTAVAGIGPIGSAGHTNSVVYTPTGGGTSVSSTQAVNTPSGDSSSIWTSNTPLAAGTYDVVVTLSNFQAYFPVVFGVMTGHGSNTPVSTATKVIGNSSSPQSASSSLTVPTNGIAILFSTQTNSTATYGSGQVQLSSSPTPSAGPFLLLGKAAATVTPSTTSSGTSFCSFAGASFGP